MKTEFNNLLQNIDNQVNEFLYKTIKEYGEDRGDYWYLDTLELRLFYDGEQTKVERYDYVWYFDENDDSTLVKIDEFIFEEQGLSKKVRILKEIYK